jgi:hypothetical protein
MSENEEKPVEEPSNVASAEPETSEGESSEVGEESHTVLDYPDRVPNAERGASHSHSYVMLKILVLMIFFSLLMAKFTSPF